MKRIRTRTVALNTNTDLLRAVLLATIAAALVAILVTSCSQPAANLSEKPPATEATAELDEATPPPPPPPPATKPMMQSLPVEARRMKGSISTMAYDVAGGAPMAMAPAEAESWRYNDDFNTEEYGRIAENPFLAVADHPLSTFGIDVDRASYANVRRFIESGQRPPRDAVRIEELVNYFSYDDPAPAGLAPFAIATEVASCPWNEDHMLMRIGLRGRSIDVKDLPANNLVFLLDVSGSMQSPDKLPLLKRSMQLLVDQLRSDDTIAIVVYAGSAGLALPPTPGTDKATIRAAIDRLEAGGSTAGGEGIILAYDTAREHFVRGGNNRVILATDGDFNVGITSDGELERLIEARRKTGIFLTVLGFGTGNIKDSKMELLADRGNGNYSYIDSIDEARKVLVHEMGGTLFTIAKDVKLQLEFNPARVAAYRLIGYENRMLRSEDFNDDRKDAGDMGAGHSVTALYELVPTGKPIPAAGVDPLKYQTTRATDAAKSSEIATVKIRYKEPDGETSRLIARPVETAERSFALASNDFRFAAAVAQFGLVLRDSEWKGDATLDDAIETAEGALGQDTEGYRAGFVELARSAKRVVNATRITRN